MISYDAQIETHENREAFNPGKRKPTILLYEYVKYFPNYT